MHRNLGTITCSLVGNPTTGRSTSRRVVWSRNLPDCPQSGHTPITATGVASMMVRGPTSAAPVMASPISAVRQMVSATRFPVGTSQCGSLVCSDGCVGTFIFTPGTPICCGDPLNPSFSTSPRYAPRNRKSPITSKILRTQVKFSQLQFIHNLPNEHSQQKSCILSVVRWRERTQRDREASAPEAPYSCGPGAEVLFQEPLLSLRGPGSTKAPTSVHNEAGAQRPRT